MYRIELSPGEEAVFRSIEELAVAIRRKVVTSRARIYHQATNKWLPIEFHPHYKAALSMPLTQADLVAGPPVTPLSALKLGEAQQQISSAAPPSPSNRQAATQAALAAWPEPKSDTPKPVLPQTHQVSKGIAPPRQAIGVVGSAPEPVRAVEPRRAAPLRVREPARSAKPTRTHEPRRMVEPVRRLFRVALAGAVLVACVHLIGSAVSTPPTKLSTGLRVSRQFIHAPAEALQDATSRSEAGIFPVQSIPVPGVRAAAIPAPAAVPLDSAPGGSEIEAAPDVGPIAGDLRVGSEPLTPQVVDSSGKKALKGILRTIGGTPVPRTQSQKP